MALCEAALIRSAVEMRGLAAANSVCLIRLSSVRCVCSGRRLMGTDGCGNGVFPASLMLTGVCDQSL